MRRLLSRRRGGGGGGWWRQLLLPRRLLLQLLLLLHRRWRRERRCVALCILGLPWPVREVLLLPARIAHVVLRMGGGGGGHAVPVTLQLRRRRAHGMGRGRLVVILWRRLPRARMGKRVRRRHAHGPILGRCKASPVSVARGSLAVWRRHGVGRRTCVRPAESLLTRPTIPL